MSSILKSYADGKFQLISNMNNYVDITTAQTVAGVKSFSVFPQTTGTPTLSNELINKSYAEPDPAKRDAIITSYAQDLADAIKLFVAASTVAGSVITPPSV
jgi:hypothetical protein